MYLQTIGNEDEKPKFQQIYEAYSQLMYYIAFRRTGNVHDAEDIVQQAFMKIAENIEKLDPPCPKTKQFVVIIVENLTINLYRYQSRRPAVPYEDAMEHSLASVSPPEGESLLTQCILKLPQQQRTVIWLKYVYGYSLREIAKLLELPPETVKKQDQRGKKLLEKLYREGGGSL